jgi:hypothetical protein
MSLEILFEDRDLGWDDFMVKLANMDGLRLEVGIFGQGKEEIVLYASANEFGAPKAEIPERPAWRAAFDENIDKYVVMFTAVAELVLYGQATWHQGLEEIGQMIVEDIRASIIAWNRPPNEDSTLDSKRRLGQGDNPLVASGAMLEAISYRIVMEGVS